MATEDVKPLSWEQPSINRISGDRLHLSHGPIDLIIRVEGDAFDVKRAYAAAIDRFQTVLSELAAELSDLRKPLAHMMPSLNSPIAKRMVEACWPHRQNFITPMAAVAGSVADEMKAVMLASAPNLHSLYVNNGGDIALYVARGCVLRIGLVADLVGALPDGVITVDHDAGIGGIATSGWRGRSFSRGIADAVTVIAETASEADAAATMLANAVDVKSAVIRRSSASALDPDSDLGEILVTADVGKLKHQEIDQALSAGESIAIALIQSRFIKAYFIALQDNFRFSRDSGNKLLLQHLGLK